MQAGVISLRSAGGGGGCFAPKDDSACFHLNQHQRAENIHQEPSAVASTLTMAAVQRENIAAVCGNHGDSRYLFMFLWRTSSSLFTFSFSSFISPWS